MISRLEIELASFASWPAFEQVEYYGWILRFANGHTKRANSVNVLNPGNSNLSMMIDHCEYFYKKRLQPSIFRLLSFVNDSTEPTLDNYLASAGYAYIDHSLVLYQKLNSTHHQSISLITLEPVSWLRTYCEILGVDLDNQNNHIKILHLIPTPSVFAVLQENGQAVACALGVVNNGYFGIFDLVTRQQFRNQGYGTKLLKQMLSWAWQAGAQSAYIQVMAQNAPAVSLYEKLGYRRIYHYWYRIKKFNYVGDRIC
ncbi:GNAT family N-acetyltransferase [Nostoc sp. CHAB 5844]|nr:GNAT family N-acetyltransferase [Nostoc sp. CHAB 5844]